MADQSSDQRIVFTQPRLLPAIVAPVSCYFAWKLAPLSYRLLALLIQKPPHSLWQLAGVSIAVILMVAVSVLCVLLSCFSLYSIISPGKLILAPDGVTFGTGGRCLHFTWQSIANFRMAPLGKGVWVVGYDLSQPKASPSRLYRFNKWMGAADGSFGFNWNASRAEIVDALNKCQAKWGH